MRILCKILKILNQKLSKPRLERCCTLRQPFCTSLCVHSHGTHLSHFGLDFLITNSVEYNTMEWGEGTELTCFLAAVDVKHKRWAKKGSE